MKTSAGPSLIAKYVFIWLIQSLMFEFVFFTRSTSHFILRWVLHLAILNVLRFIRNTPLRFGLIFLSHLLNFYLDHRVVFASFWLFLMVFEKMHFHYLKYFNCPMYLNWVLKSLRKVASRWLVSRYKRHLLVLYKTSVKEFVMLVLERRSVVPLWQLVALLGASQSRKV